MIARPARRSENRRGAASLIEVLASMALISVLFGTSATLTALLFRLERLGRAERDASVAEALLAADLRDDAHAALRVAPEGPVEELRLLGPGGWSASYRIGDGAIDRTRGVPDGVDQHERYRLLPGTSARWEPEGGGRRVALVLDAPAVPKAIEGARRVIRIEAAIGRDHRFEGDIR